MGLWGGVLGLGGFCCLLKGEADRWGEFWGLLAGRCDLIKEDGQAFG